MAPGQGVHQTRHQLAPTASIGVFRAGPPVPLVRTRPHKGRVLRGETRDLLVGAQGRSRPRPRAGFRSVVLEYGDYECPYSRQAFRQIELVERDERRLRFAFRHFPLTESTPRARQRRPQPRRPRSRAGSGRCTSCSSTASTHSRTTTSGGTPPSSASTWRGSTRPPGAGVLAPDPTRRRERRGIRRGAGRRHCSSTASCTVGGYDASTLLEALAR